jgi:hypothetical protein
MLDMPQFSSRSPDSVSYLDPAYSRYNIGAYFANAAYWTEMSASRG